MRLAYSIGMKSQSLSAERPVALRLAKLIYASDQSLGIRRRRQRGTFTYFTAEGRPIAAVRIVARIRALAIPPAWQNVWICPDPRGHIQATGRDARGRKQYIYHPDWRAVRDDAKYGRLVDFARCLGKIRRRLRRDLRRRGLCKDKVLAAVVELMEATRMRVGNEEYARRNQSFGITTLRGKHVSVRGAHMRFRFRGKSGVQHVLDLCDRRLARIVRSCQELPGEELFQFEGDDGKIHSVKSDDVNAYLREAAGIDCSAKDLRTWAGTVAAAAVLRDFDAFPNATQAKRNVAEAMSIVAKRLGNTRAVCRRCYVHPGIIDAYLNGSLVGDLTDAIAMGPIRIAHLTDDERAVFAFLRLRSRPARRRSKAAAAPLRRDSQVQTKGRSAPPASGVIARPRRR
jgi:DNA topoisomerase-1